ncbi:hypothetical protein PISMIDRAFT_14837 [Pisolithus microcarpus 441]|uniref:Uncharacterized protein n=1 Tax=Pisolithus microcarpus 441 TaxID=765257 RepID=A0A0C9YM20_9AGAM|nr:hypothetical protein PISMIDRAFT_14837 [Pisolithus microcarpus 441]
MSSSITHPQMIVPWEMTLLEELEDKPGDSVAIKMAKFDEREQEAKAKRIRQLEAEHKWLKEEMRRAQQAGGSLSQQVPASTGKAVERPNGCNMDDGDDEAMEDTPDVKMKDSMAEVLNRRLGEVMKLLQKNNTAIETLAKDIWDLSRVLEESFEALKAVMMTLVNHAQNEEGV